MERDREPNRYTIDIISAMAERTIKKLWGIIILLIILLGGSNAAWIWYESQFMEEEWTFEATTDDGGNAIANGNGEVYYYGESESNPSETNP